MNREYGFSRAVFDRIMLITYIFFPMGERLTQAIIVRQCNSFPQKAEPYTLFENLVIVEAMKFRLNRVKRSNLSFYRDSSGHEVDLLLSSDSQLFPIEIKSGATINRDYFKGLNYFSTLGIPSITSGAVIYAGSNPQTRGLWQACPLQQMEPLLQSL